MILSMLFLMFGSFHAKIIVIDNIQDLKNYYSQSTSDISKKQSKLLSDDGFNLEKTQSERSLEQKHNGVNSIICSWRKKKYWSGKCYTDDECKQSIGCAATFSLTYTPPGGSGTTTPEKPEPVVPKVGEFVKKVDDLRPNTLYCLMFKHSMQPVKMDDFNNKSVHQTPSKDCASGSLFQFVDSESSSGSFTTRIMDRATYNFWGVDQQRAFLLKVKGFDRKESSNWQRWEIFKANFNDADKGWFHIKNVELGYLADCEASAYTCSVITYGQAHKGPNQTFGIKVMKVLA